MTEIPMVMKEEDERNVEMLLAKSHSTKTRWHSIKVVGGEFKTDKWSAALCSRHWILGIYWRLCRQVVHVGSKRNCHNQSNYLVRTEVGKCVFLMFLTQHLQVLWECAGRNWLDVCSPHTAFPFATQRAVLCGSFVWLSSIYIENLQFFSPKYFFYSCLLAIS